MRLRLRVGAPARDALAATAALIAAIALGSGGGATLDPALFGYLGATLVAVAATTWRASAFWRRRPSAFYARAFLAALRDPRRLRRAAAHGAADLAAQDFIRRRSLPRWIAHLMLSLGTLASFAITLPLVFGWMHFTAAGPSSYRMVVLTLPTVHFEIDGAFAWLLFHGLALAALAVVAGALYFLLVRLRRRALPGAAAGFAIAPLALLLVVALTGLALPASRDWPAAFRLAAWSHQVAVVVLLVALPFSKLGHVLVRPLQIGARLVRAPGEPRRSCGGCGADLAPVAQQRAVAELLARRGLPAVLDLCPACRRRRVAAAQASLVGAHFQPGAVEAGDVATAPPPPAAREVA